MQTTRFGRDGETAAEKYLEGKGYHFLTRNFKRTHGEIDLIMEDGETLVFIEVKSRTNRRYGEPKEAVTPFKQQHIRYTAKAFACSRQYRRPAHPFRRRRSHADGGWDCEVSSYQECVLKAGMSGW